MKLFFVHKYMHKSHLLPVVFNDHFQLNNCVHSYVTRSSDKIHLFAADSFLVLNVLNFNGACYGITCLEA